MFLLPELRIHGYPQGRIIVDPDPHLNTRISNIVGSELRLSLSSLSYAADCPFIPYLFTILYEYISFHILHAC